MFGTQYIDLINSEILKLSLKYNDSSKLIEDKVIEQGFNRIKAKLGRKQAQKSPPPTIDTSDANIRLSCKDPALTAKKPKDIPSDKKSQTKSTRRIAQSPHENVILIQN